MYYFFWLCDLTGSPMWWLQLALFVFINLFFVTFIDFSLTLFLSVDLIYIFAFA